MCQHEHIKLFGHHRNATQRLRCISCGKTLSCQRVNNFLVGEQKTALRKCFESGMSIRASARAVGVRRNTAWTYYKLWNISALCGCGKPATHRGWCAVRFDQSPKRQEFMKQWRAA